MHFWPGEVPFDSTLPVFCVNLPPQLVQLWTFSFSFFPRASERRVLPIVWRVGRLGWHRAH